MIGLANTAAQVVFNVDVKGRRKVSSDEQIVLVVRTDDTLGAGIRVGVGLRTLLRVG